MSAYNNEYSVLEQDNQLERQEPLYHLFVGLLLQPCYQTAKELYWALQEASASPYTPLTDVQVELSEALFVLLQVLQTNRDLDTGNPLWLVPLRLANIATQMPFSLQNSKPVYVVRRLKSNPFQLGVFATSKPLYTEQVFPNQAMAELAAYRNQPFTGVYDSYFYNTHYGAGAPKAHRRIVSIPERTRTAGNR